jgi:putative transposase
VSYAFIEDNRQRWPVSWMCDALGVSTSGYYSWLERDPSPQEQRRELLAVEVETVHAEVKARYGSPRIHAELADRGHDCCVNTVARIMREAGISAKTKRKFRQTTDSNHGLPVAENVLDRDFAPTGPNESWCADITYIPTREGWLYLAVVEDLFSRMVVGWSMDATMESRLVVDALEMAVLRRLQGSSSSDLVAHSDRGSQYASEHYQRLLAEEGIVCSMSRRGNCWDNAPMESFFATLKKELVHDEDYATREEAKASIFEYIETFYNRVRRHSTLGYLSPVNYEAANPQ